MESPNAPTDVEDNCPLGDTPGIFESTGKTCADLIASEPGQCRQAYINSSCCESCNNARVDNAGKLPGFQCSPFLILQFKLIQRNKRTVSSF